MTDNNTRINTIAALIAPAGKGRPTRHERLRILHEQGPHALVDAVFPPSLFNPELDLAHEEAARMVTRCAGMEVDIITADQPNYPQLLNSTRGNPGVLFCKGTVDPLDPAVAIIGMREPTAHHQHRAANLACALIQHGYTVSSGLATGIDTVAHTTSVEANARTIAVMGTAPEITYPEHNAPLRQRIESNGASITQFPPGTETSAYAFPKRNETMSGISLATIIVAAGEHSGTQHQAAAAVGQGRLLCVSQEVAHATTWGARLVSGGHAVVVEHPDQVLELVSSKKDQLLRQ